MRRVLGVAAALFTLTLVVPSASAGEVSANVTAHVLTVTGTELDETAAITCADGEVVVDGAAPAGGPEPCSRLREIEVSMGGGNDRVTLAGVTRSVFSGLRSISVSGEDGDDTLIGSDRVDLLSGGGGHDWIRAGAGADVLVPGPGWNAINGGPGRDMASFSGDGSWWVSDGSVGRSAPVEEQTTLRSVDVVEVVGGSGADLIAGDGFSGPVILVGGGGNDLITSGSRDDVLEGGTGNDWLDGNAGNDVMDGGAGDDVLRGDEGNDDMNGGPGTDVCLSGPGADRAISC